VFRTSSNSVKWDKAKALVQRLQNIYQTQGTSTEFDYKELERTRGFLVHLSMTYKMFRHHLKGFHLTLSSYTGHRDEDGWKIGDRDWLIYVQNRVDSGVLSQEEADQLLNNIEPGSSPPKTIKPVPQLIDDIYALSKFL
jgi:hypothetical protein